MDKTELVRYNNDMNQLTFTGFTKSNYDLFMAICSRIKGHGTEVIHLSFDELINMAQFSDRINHDLVEELDAMTDKLLMVNCKKIERTESGHRKISKFDLFPTLDIDEASRQITVGVNQRWVWLLNEYTNYTSFELAEFVSLKSKYSKSLYRILKQWRTVGQYTFHDIEDFKRIMDVPKSYTNRIFTDKVINPVVEEIQKIDGSFKNLRCEVVKERRRGNPIKAYTFTWEPEKIATLQQKQKKTKFSNFQEREQDFDDLEKRLLNQ